MAKIDDSTIISCMTNYRQESEMARRDRIERNRLNFDCYNLREDYSFKKKGQSRETLPKVTMAVDQAANFLQQGLVDLGEWFKVEPEEGMIADMMAIKPEVIRRLTDRQLRKAFFYGKVGDMVKSGFLGSLMILKVYGKYVNKPIYKAKHSISASGKYVSKLEQKDRKVWQTCIDIVRQEDYFPDPTGNGLYEMQDVYMDYHELEELAERGYYDKAAVLSLKGTSTNEGYDKSYNKAREVGQNPTNSGYRRKIKVTEIWGKILGSDGELLMDNCMTTIANDRVIIKAPEENPFWHGKSPFVAVPIITIPNSVWGRAPMDAPVALNKAVDEMFNLMLDGGLMAVHGIKQIREHWLEDPSQVDEGISAGDTLKVNASCPPGGQALERVDTSSVPQEGFNMMNLLNQELYASSFTNDLRMGVASFRQVKATEVVEANQTISNMFSGMAKQIEEQMITPVLEKVWANTCQYMDDMDMDEVKALIGDKAANDILAMGNEELFAASVQGSKFRVFGISATLNKQKDFTKLTGLLQTIGSSPVFQEAFVAKYDFTQLLSEIMKSLDINPAKLQPPEVAVAPASAGPQQPQGGMPGMAPGAMPDMQSQIPQAMAAGNQGDLNAIPSTEFPSSRATPSGGM